MPSLTYAAPATIEEVVHALAGAAGTAKPLAGGTDLLVQLRTGRAKPDLIVDTKKIISKEKNKPILSPDLHQAIGRSLAEAAAARNRGPQACCSANASSR